MITLTELQTKEVVRMEGGKRLGQIMDLEIDNNSGIIKHLIILDRHGKGALFQKPQEIKIAWKQIVTIGTDIILVNDEIEQKEPPKQKK